MFNKKEVFIRLGALITSFAMVAPRGGCTAFWGEPKLPNKLQK